MKANNWTIEIMESTNGMVKVLPNKLLFDKIQNKINLENKVSNKWIFVAAATFALLISINIKLLSQFSLKEAKAIPYGGWNLEKYGKIPAQFFHVATLWSEKTLHIFPGGLWAWKNYPIFPGPKATWKNIPSSACRQSRCCKHVLRHYQWCVNATNYGSGHTP